MTNVLGLSRVRVAPFAGQEMVGQLRPAVPPGPETFSWDVGPEHIFFELEADGVPFYLYIYPLAELPKFSTTGSMPAPDYFAIAEAIRTRQPDAQSFYYPSVNAGRNIMVNNRYLDFDGGVGFRWLTHVAQGVSSCSDLLYEFNGVTHDGRYVVVARYWEVWTLNGGCVPQDVDWGHNGYDSLPPDPYYANLSYDEWLKQNQAWQAAVQLFNAQARERLSSAPPNEFSPSLDSLDAWVQSLVIQP